MSNIELRVHLYFTEGYMQFKVSFFPNDCRWGGYKYRALNIEWFSLSLEMAV